MREILGRNANPRVADGYLGPAVAAPHAEGHFTACRRVFQRVHYQIQEELAQPVRVTLHQRLIFRAQPQNDTACHHTRLTIHIEQQRVQLHWLQAELQPGVRLGQEQQIIDQPPHARRLVADGAQGVAAHGRIFGRAATEQIEVALDGGKRRAQFVANIGHEPLLHLKEGFQPPQHVIDCLCEPAELVGGHGDRDPLAQVIGVCDLLRGLGDRLDGPQGRARQDVTDHRCQHQTPARCPGARRGG